MKLKRIISAALCAALATSMAACGAPADTSASTPVQQSVSVSVPAAPTEVPTLTMLTFTEWYKDGWKALENYINENSDELGFKLDIQQIAGGSEGEEVVKARFATGDLPDMTPRRWRKADTGTMVNCTACRWTPQICWDASIIRMYLKKPASRSCPRIGTSLPQYVKRSKPLAKRRFTIQAAILGRCSVLRTSALIRKCSTAA